MSNESVASRWPLRWIVLPLLLFFFLASAVVIYAFVIRQTARSILKDVYTLRVGVSSTADVERVVARHRHALRERHCDSRKCFIAFEVYNTWLYRLKLEPIARFRVDVEENEGTVNFIEVDLSRDTRVYPTSPSGGITDEYQRVPDRMLKFSKRLTGFQRPSENPI